MNLTASVSLGIKKYRENVFWQNHHFLQSTVASNRGIKATEMILKTLEKADAPEPEVKKEEENFDDLTLFEMTKDESSISLQAPEPLNMSMDSGDDFDKL